ncbi:hypothetical protein ACJX0J_015777, partial [Zea mays]
MEAAMASSEQADRPGQDEEDDHACMMAMWEGEDKVAVGTKIVIKADLIGEKCKSEILAIVSKNQGIKSMTIDAEKCTLTVVGTVDPVRVVQRLKKKCFEATIVSVEDDKPAKKDPCKEACEKLCKERCDKVTCCKECKE